MMQRLLLEDFTLKETNPHLGGGKVTDDKLTSTYDLVEQMQYLYIRVVKAKDLPGKDVTGTCDPYVEVKLGNYKRTTRHFEKKSNPEWNQVFAFSNERIQASLLEVTVKDKDFVKDDFMGRVMFDLNEIPKRVPPDSPLAPQWYRLEDRKGDKVKGELMLAVWMGTKADETFPEACYFDAATVSGTDGLANIRSKVYLSPKLWYLRVNVIEAEDLIPNQPGRFPEAFVRATLGNQVLRTKISAGRATNPMWNEDLMLVAAEPFEESLILTVEDRVGGKEELLGRCIIPLQDVDRRLDHKPVNRRRFNLQKCVVIEREKKKETKFASRIHVRICLEGSYHVLDESTHYSSDLRPTAKRLWKSSIGVLELGILNAHGLLPMKTKDGRRTTDAFCVAKYGQKWVRTRTIIDSFTPKWNEQYTWEVFDPCTVITIGVFDNYHLYGGDKAGGEKDKRIGKVRIRLSTLETDRAYSSLYPLLVLYPNGVIKKMGEIHLAVRFTCSSLLNMMHMYSLPLLPKMHYLHPLTVSQLESSRHWATQILSMRLGRAEPPLRREVVEYMQDVGSDMWSVGRSKDKLLRIMGVFAWLFYLGRWFDRVCNWINPITTVLIHILFIILVLYPEVILPTIFLYLFLIGVYNYRWRPRHPTHMNPRYSHVDPALPDELCEQFDSFPTSRPSDIVRMRYDRLRSSAGKIQTLFGDLATQGDRLQSLLNWRDPRATAVFVIFCLVAAIVLYVTPFHVVVLLTGFYMLRHPRFRHKLPSVPLNFFKRLPARTDFML